MSPSLSPLSLPPSHGHVPARDRRRGDGDAHSRLHSHVKKGELPSYMLLPYESKKFVFLGTSSKASSPNTSARVPGIRYVSDLRAKITLRSDS